MGSPPPPFGIVNSSPPHAAARSSANRTSRDPRYVRAFVKVYLSGRQRRAGAGTSYKPESAVSSRRPRAIADDLDRLVLVGDRRMAAGGIDDAQAPHPEQQALVGERAGVPCPALWPRCNGGVAEPCVTCPLEIGSDRLVGCRAAPLLFLFRKGHLMRRTPHVFVALATVLTSCTSEPPEAGESREVPRKDFATADASSFPCSTGPGKNSILTFPRFWSSITLATAVPLCLWLSAALPSPWGSLIGIGTDSTLVCPAFHSRVPEGEASYLARLRFF